MVKAMRLDVVLVALAVWPAGVVFALALCRAAAEADAAAGSRERQAPGGHGGQVDSAGR